MGSLVSGWNSPRSGRFEKRKSFTEEEIDNFWKVKRGAEEEHLRAVVETDSEISEVHDQISIIGGRGSQSFPANRPARLEVSNSFTQRVSEDAQSVTNGESVRDKKLAWWTRSNWAFLNEPPQSEMDGHAYKYAAQHEVAMIGGQKQGLSPDLMASTS
ncbi:hypothetical protein SUGI_0351600 [Cryptomeria japonica]|uniref:uncharacterized protein LOC131029481 n=1 Tax=Cryptomeria japonica TaxID=3369 RepID=UPI002408C7EA|nr:uncharacterized protein LOC131029481 [Cryptomeria japonica]GLJ19471.1 hypothetical protein SUGI_0351600 [Cryptomeria japonica]